MAPGLGNPVVGPRSVPAGSAVERIASRLIESDVALERSALLAAASAIAREEDPVGHATTAGAAVDALVGLGPLQALLADPDVTDVLVNGPHEVWVERHGRLERTGVTFPSAGSIRALVERLIAPLGLRLDQASPVVDARLPDGSRLHAILAPIAADGPIMTIRRFTSAVSDLAALEQSGSISSAAASVLRTAVHERRNLLVCGGTGAGKTTLLNLLSHEISDGDRIVTIEDARELRLSGHVVSLEARPHNSEGRGEISIRELVRHALRLRPDRLVVGEVRGPEALDMIQAMATGHAGSMSTLHARDAEEALWRLELLALSTDSGMGPDAVRGLLRSSLDLVITMQRRGAVREVVAVTAVTTDGLEVLA